MKVNQKQFENSSTGLKSAHRFLNERTVISEENRKLRDISVSLLEKLSKEI